MEAHVLEADFTPADTQGFCMRRIGDPGTARERPDAVGNGADVLEQGGEFPHDPMGDAVEAQRERGGCRHAAHPHVAVGP